MNAPRLIVLLALLFLGTVLPAAEPDFADPAFQELRQAWEREKGTLSSARTRAYADMLDTRIREAEADIQEKIAARNVKAISVARKAKQIAEESLATVRSNGTFTLPANVRRELDDWVKQLDEEKKAADRQADASLAELKNRYLGRFAQTVAAKTGQPAPQGEALSALFDKLIEWVAPPPPPAAGSTNAAAGSTNALAGSTNLPADSPWFASNGESTNWFTAGLLSAEINAQDVFSVPIFNVTSSFTAAKNHPLSGKSSTITYELLQPLALIDAGRCVFRLKRLPDHKPVAVLGWPSTLNRGRLEFRTAALSLFPSTHGFELEAAYTGPATAAAPVVEVRIDTLPAGAEIRLNGRRVVGSDGNPSLTPARLRIPATPSTLTLALKDHVSKTFDRWTPESGKAITWKFQHESALPPKKTVKLDPGKSWIPSEVPVQPGDRIWLVPAGQWTIGTRGELTGPDGYPETVKFAHYYAGGVELRQKVDAPYGCLLAKTSLYGEPVAVTNTTLILSPSAGALFFDVNEKAGKEVRRDNRGSMAVSIVIIPIGS